MAVHTPVLRNEVMECLNPQPNENFVDGTVGEGGHAIEILKRTSPEGKLIGIDLDPGQIQNSYTNLAGFAERVELVNDSYTNIKEIVGITPIHGILVDLGYSSWQMEQSGKGFSFQKDEVLDMRYQPDQELTADMIVNEWPEQEITHILKEYGEEDFSKQIAKKIVTERKRKRIHTTKELIEVIAQAIPARHHHGRIHYATRTFQALRIAVNGELDSLSAFLPAAVEVLEKGGRLVVISFHSLEDRIVKQCFKDAQGIEIVTKKPIEASEEEVKKNPRARSAKLRAIIKL